MVMIGPLFNSLL